MASTKERTPRPETKQDMLADFERELRDMEAELRRGDEEARAQKENAESARGELIQKMVKEAALMIVGNKELQTDATQNREQSRLSLLQKEIDTDESRLEVIEDKFQCLKDSISKEKSDQYQETIQKVKTALEVKKNIYSGLEKVDAEQAATAQDPISFAVQTVVAVHRDTGGISDDDVASVTNEVTQGITEEALAKAKAEKPVVVEEGRRRKKEEALRTEDMKIVERDRDTLAQVSQKFEQIKEELSQEFKKLQAELRVPSFVNEITALKQKLEKKLSDRHLLTPKWKVKDEAQLLYRQLEEKNIEVRKKIGECLYAKARKFYDQKTNNHYNDPERIDILANDSHYYSVSDKQMQEEMKKLIPEAQQLKDEMWKIVKKYEWQSQDMKPLFSFCTDEEMKRFEKRIQELVR